MQVPLTALSTTHTRKHIPTFIPPLVSKFSRKMPQLQYGRDAHTSTFCRHRLLQLPELQLLPCQPPLISPRKPYVRLTLLCHFLSHYIQASASKMFLQKQIHIQKGPSTGPNDGKRQTLEKTSRLHSRHPLAGSQACVSIVTHVSRRQHSPARRCLPFSSRTARLQFQHC